MVYDISSKFSIFSFFLNDLFKIDESDKQSHLLSMGESVHDLSCSNIYIKERTRKNECPFVWYIYIYILRIT